MLEPFAKTGSGAPCAEFRLSKGCLPTTSLLPASRLTCRTNLSATCKDLEPWSSPRATFSTLELRAHTHAGDVPSPRPIARTPAGRREPAIPIASFPVLGTGSAFVPSTPSRVAGTVRRNAASSGWDGRLIGSGLSASSCWERRGLFRDDGLRLSLAGTSRDTERHHISRYHLRLGQRQ